MSIKSTLKELLLQIPTARQFLYNREFGIKKVKNAKARVVFSILTEGGIYANGKISAHLFLPSFANELAEKGISSHLVFSIGELEKLLKSKDIYTVIIHLYGEDHADILSDDVICLEEQADAVYNSAVTGKILADKLKTDSVLKQGGIKLPPITKTDGFVRERFGTKRPTQLKAKLDTLDSDQDHITTKFIDTRQKFKDNDYYTTVRLLCVDDLILHAFVRARDANSDDASVHSADTPLDSGLLEFLQGKLVEKNWGLLEALAKDIHSSLGNGFFAHDLLIENNTGEIYVCESGLKFDDAGFWGHIEPIKDELPSHAVFFPVENFAKLSASCFISKIVHLQQSVDTRPSLGAV